MPCQRKGNGPPQKLPRVIRKGGVEVLDTVPLTEDTQYKVEAVLLPNFGKAATTGNFQSRGLPYTMSDTLGPGAALCYSVAVINLPEIPDAMCEDTMIVWEAYRLETELLFAPQMASSGYQRANGTLAGIEGTQLYFWACGGGPLDVIGINPDPERLKVNEALEGPGNSDVASLQALRKQVNAANFPVELWVADPTKNDNTRYFGRVVGGGVTPPVVSYGNQSTTPLIDENGVGILCNFGSVYLTSADMVGMTGLPGLPTLSADYSNQRTVQAGYGRFFRVHCRQRRIKHPYTVDMMFRQFLQPQKPQVQGQQPAAVQEVTMEQMQPATIPPTVEGGLGFAPTSKFLIQNGELIYPSSNAAAAAAKISVAPKKNTDKKEL